MDETSLLLQTLHDASKDGDFKAVTGILDENPELVSETNKYGNRVLGLAAFNGDFDIVEYICDNFPSVVDKTGASGYTALHWAAQNGKVNIAGYLLHKRYDLIFNVTTNIGRSALDLAALHGQEETFDCLLTSNNEMLTWVTYENETVLHSAAKSANQNLVEKILEIKNLKQV